MIQLEPRAGSHPLIDDIGIGRISRIALVPAVDFMTQPLPRRETASPYPDRRVMPCLTLNRFCDLSQPEPSLLWLSRLMLP